MTREYIEMCVNEWYGLLDILSGCDMENVREFFRNGEWGDITNDTKDYIDVNYKHILVTFTPIPNSGYEEYGGKARLEPNFKVYNENGVFCGVYNNLGEEVL